MIKYSSIPLSFRFSMLFKAIPVLKKFLQLFGRARGVKVPRASNHADLTMSTVDQSCYAMTPVFLDASSHLYKRVCPSVHRSVRPSVGPSIGP